MNRGKSKLQLIKKKASDQPATRGMLSNVKRELKSELARLVLLVEDQRRELKFEMAELRAKMEGNFHRLALLMEEQRAENRIVLDGVRALWERQDRIEQHFI